MEGVNGSRPFLVDHSPSHFGLSPGTSNAAETDGYLVFTIPGGFQVPSPGGRMEGGSVFG